MRPSVRRCNPLPQQGPGFETPSKALPGINGDADKEFLLCTMLLQNPPWGTCHVDALGHMCKLLYSLSFSTTSSSDSTKGAITGQCVPWKIAEYWS